MAYDVPTHEIPFDPDPIYTLGNAWITFGDLLDEKIAEMAGAEFGVTSGAWVGEASNSMSAAFQNNMGVKAARAGLRPTVEQCAEACWELGEQINYFGMLRNEQAIAEKKLALVQLLAGVLGAFLGLLTGIFLEGFAIAVGAVLANVASRLGSLVSGLLRLIPALEKAVGTVTQAAVRVTAGIGDMYAGAVNVVGKVLGFSAEGGSAAAGAAGRRAPWSLVAGRVVVYGTDFIVNNAVSTAAANAAVGLPTDWKNWKPVPTDAEGWLNLVATGIMLFPIMVAGARVFSGPSNKFTGWVTAKFDPSGVISGTGAVNSKTNPNLFPGGSGDGGRTTAGSSGLVTPGASTRIDSGARPVTNSRASGGDGIIHQPIPVRDAHNVPANGGTTDIGGPAVRVTGGRAVPDSARGTDVSAPSSRIATPDGIGHTQVGARIPHGETPRVTVDNGPVDGARTPAAGHGSGHVTAPDPVAQAGAHPVVRTGADPGVRTAPNPVGRTAPDPVAQAGAHPVVRTGADAVARTAPDPGVRTAPDPVARAAAPVPHGEAAGGARLSGAAPHGDARSEGTAPPGGSRSQEPASQGGTRQAETPPPGDSRTIRAAGHDGETVAEAVPPAHRAAPSDTSSRPGEAPVRPSDTSSRPGETPARPADTTTSGGQVAPRSVEEAARQAGTSSRPGDAYGRSAAAPRAPLGERAPATAVSEGDAGARPLAERQSGANTPARTADTSTGRPSRNDAETSVGASTVDEGPVVRTSRSALTGDAHEGRGAGTTAGRTTGGTASDLAAAPATQGEGAAAAKPAAAAPHRDATSQGPDAGRPAANRGPGPNAGRGNQDPASGPRPDPVHEDGPSSESGSPHAGSAHHDPGVQPDFQRQPDDRYVTEADGLLDLGDGRPPAHVPAGSEGVFDAAGSLRLVQLPGKGLRYDRFLDGGWVRRKKSGEVITVKMTNPLKGEPGTVVLGSEVVLDKGLPGDRGQLRDILGADNARLRRRLIWGGLGTAKPVAIRNVVKTADGQVSWETLVPDGKGGWHQSHVASDSLVQAGLAGANRAVGAARTLYDIAGREGLHKLSADELRVMLLDGSEADRIAAAYALVTGDTGKALRWTQVAGVEALGDGAVLNMAAGEGKSLVFLADAIKRAATEGVDALHVITTRENLANREATIYRRVLEPLGYKVHRMNHNEPPPPAVKGEPTIYIGTAQDVGFTVLHVDKVDGRPAAETAKEAVEGADKVTVHASIDEIDEAVVYADTRYILSEGTEKAATSAVAAEVLKFHDLVKRLPETLLVPKPGERTDPHGLTEAAREWAREQLGHQPSAGEVNRLKMALLAENVYKGGIHYEVYDRGDSEGAKLYILDQVTHAVMFDPKTSTQSRWMEGLAQAIEAKHGITIRGDSEHSKSVTFKQLLVDHYDKVVGASGTAKGKSGLFAEGGLSRHGERVEIREAQRYYHSLLERIADVISPNIEKKIEQIADDTYREHTETGRPQAVIAHRNDLVAQVKEALEMRGAKDVVAIDARWMLEQGVNREEAFAAVIEEAGQQGKILVINMQGARGVDIPLSATARNLGGLHVRVTAHSSISGDIDVQAENRAGRSGDPGSVTYYASPDDAIFQLPHNGPHVGVAVIKYVNAHRQHLAEIHSAGRDTEPGGAGAHSPQPSTATHADADAGAHAGSTAAALREAEDGLRNLIRPLQQIVDSRRGMDVPVYEAHGPPTTDTSIIPATDAGRLSGFTPSKPPPRETAHTSSRSGESAQDVIAPTVEPAGRVGDVGQGLDGQRVQVSPRLGEPVQDVVLSEASAEPAVSAEVRQNGAGRGSVPGQEAVPVRTRVGRVPMAPDDAYSAYDPNYQVGDSTGMAQFARGVLAQFAGSAPDMNALARRLLHLDGTAVPNAADRDNLHELVAVAAREGYANSLAEIGALDLLRRGVLDDQFVMYDAAMTPVGRDWTGNARWDLIEFMDVPWQEKRWTVSAHGGPERPLLRDVDGRELAVNDWAEFAELLRRDPLRPSLGDLAIMVERAGARTLEGPARVADVLGVKTWSTNGPNTWSAGEIPEEFRDEVEVAVWIPNTPGQRSRAVPGALMDINGLRIPDSRIDSVTMMDADGENSFGRAVMSPRAMATEYAEGRETRVTHYTLAEVRRRPDGSREIVRESEPRPLPRHPSYTLAYHGDAVSAEVPLTDGSSTVASLEEIARYAARRGSVQSLGEQEWVLFEGCENAQHSDGAGDLLRHPRGIQRMANASRKNIMGSPVQHLFRPEEETQGQLYPARMVLVVESIDNPGDVGIMLASPEPTPQELEALVQQFGGPFAQRPEEAGQRLLTWIRAAREAFGPEFGPRDPLFAEAMSRFAALDWMRVNAGNTGPLTLTWLKAATERFNVALNLTRGSWAGLPSLLNQALAEMARGVPSAPVEALESAVDMSAPGLDSLAEPVVVGLVPAGVPVGVGRSVVAGVVPHGGEGWWGARAAAGEPVFRERLWTSVPGRDASAEAGGVREPGWVRRLVAGAEVVGGQGAFWVRRFEHGGVTYTDVEVRTRLTGVDGLTESQLAAFWERLSEDIDGAFNRPLDGAHRLPNGDVLHVTPVRVLDEGGEADWEPVVYRLVPGVEPKDQPVKPSQFHLPFELIAGRGLGAHEFGHQIGWPDEHVEEGADPELALDVLGSLMGRFTCSFDKDVKAAYPEEVAGLEPAGVRDRNLLMLGSTIFDSKSDVITAGDGTELTPTPQPVAARPRVGRVPMAPDDAHDAYDTQGLAQALDQALAQAGVAAETKQHAYDVLTGLVGGEPDLAALARRLLHLDGSVVPDETVLGWLYELVVTADQAGRAYSPAAIGAFDLQRRGALGARSQLIDETGWLTGRDWTRDTNELQLDTYQVGDRNGRRLFGSHDAPWTQQRWVVSAVARRGLPVVADGEGNPLAVHDWEEFAELLEYDSEWQQPRSELVIVVDRAGERTLEGPAFVADRLNVRTWSANSRIIQFTAPDGERVLRLVGRGAVWIPNDPGQRSRAVLGSVADVNGVEIPDGQIVSTAMVGIDGQGTGGRFMLTPEQIAAEFLDRSQISNVEHFTYAEIETRPDGSARIVRESKAHRLPFPLPAYTMVFHFDGTVGQVPLIDGSSRDAPIDEIAGYHGRRGSFQSSVRPGDSVMALACKATRHRINADDPFGDPSAFQRAANMLGTPVVGANVRIGYAPKSGNYPDRYNLEVKDIRRPAGAGFETAYPELNAHQLQEWAQRLGGPLGQRPEEQQLLRWLRAARFAFGAKLGPDESNFERAMRAFQELDALRALDGDTGPLTLSKLWDITADYNKAKGLEQSWAGLLLLLDEVLSLTGRGVPSAPVEALESAVDMSAPGLDSLAEPVVVGLVPAGVPVGVGRSVVAGVVPHGGEGWWGARAAAGEPVFRERLWTSVPGRDASAEAGGVREPGWVRRLVAGAEVVGGQGAFWVRRFEHGGVTYTDVEVRTRLTGVDGLTESQLAAFWERLSEDIDGAFNRPLDGAHRLPNGDVLHVTPVRVLDEGGEADWEPVVYRLVPGVEPKDQPVKPSQFHLPFELIAGRGLGAHEFGHQIGWPDEHVEEGADPELALDVLGSLMGRFTCSFDKDVKAAYPEEVAGLEPAGVRDRNLLMLGSTIFDSKSDVITAGDGTELTPTPQPVAARPRVGRVPMAPDDAHDAYDTQGQTGVSPETRRLAEEVLDEVLPEAAGRQVVVESARVEERPAAVVAASGVTDEVLPEAAGRQVGVEGQEEWLSAEGPASVALPAVSGSVEERAAIAEEVPAKDLVEASAEGPKEQVPAVGLVEEVPAADLEEPERGRRPHRTGPSRRSRAVSFDVPDSRRATHQEDTSGRPVRPEAEPAPASRPALAGLNLDAVPVGRAPAEPGGVSERVAEPLAVPEEVPAAVPVTVEVGRAQADPAAVPAEDVQAARGELDEVEQVGRDKGKDKGKAAVVPPVVLPVDSGNQSGEGRQAPPSARTADGDNASRPPGTGDPVAAAHAAENPPLVEVTPAVVEAVPAVVEAAPAVVEVTPAAVEAVPAVVEVTPAAVEAVPAVVEVTPAVVEAVPAVVEVAPVVVEAVPAVVEVAPVVAEVTSPAVGTTRPLTAAPPGTAPGTPVVDPDRIAEPPRVIGRSVPVPATGDCLLYSFAASDPLYIRDRLPGLNTRHPQAYAWLGDPDAVRAELGALAAAYSETRVLPDTGHSRVVIDAMRGQAASHLGEHAGALSPQILQQLRGALTPGFGARVAGMARADLLTHLAHHRVTTPATFEGLGLESELRTRYRNARAAELIGRGERPAAEVQAEVQAEAEILGTRELFGRLAQRGLLPPVAELTTDQLRTVLSTAYVGSTAPLDRGESVAVAEAVTNWAGNWDSPVGEMFLPLLAHAFGVRADVVRAGRGEITSVGPDDATHRIEVHYNGVDHYNGSDVAGWPLPSAQDERLLSAGPQPVASGSATPAPAPAPALNLSEGPPPTVLAPLPARTSLAFPSGAHDVGAEALERIRELAGKVAKAGILANYAKIALPRFSVVGHGNGPLLAVGDRGARRASEVGGLRAKAAADTLYDELVRALQFLQANTPGEDLIAASDFDFDERSAGRDLGDGRGDGSPRDRRRQAVIGIVEAPRAAAAARLDALRRQDPRFAAGRFDPDTLARHVLHLPAGATVTAADRDALYALVDRAAAVGQARSVARLGAFHLRGHGLLSETTFTALAGASPTRNWMGIPLTGIDTATYDETVGTVTRQVTPPWVTGPAAPPPYVVVAAGGDDRGISVAGTSGPPRRVTAEDLTELLAMDDRLAALGKDVPVLLVAPGAGSMGLDLPRAVAAGTGRTVWAHSGAPALIAPAGGVLYRIGVAGDRAGGIPLGQWIPSHPGDLGTPNPDAGNAVVETIAGVRVPDRDIVSVAMAPNGVRKGRALFSDADLAMRERYFDVTTQLTDWYPADPVQHDFDGPRPMPVRGGLAYFVYVHGRPGATMVNVRHDPTPRQVTGRQFGRFLRRRPSVRDLDPAVPFVLLSCWGAAAPGLPNWIDAPGARAPFVADPLSTLSVAEEVADENGRTVFASDRVHVGFTRSNGTHGHGIVSDPLGETGEWREVRPRPSDAELADLARVAGLYDGPGPVPKQVTDTTLRLVRALRVLFGPSIEDNRHDPADPYRELLRGMGTLEIMRDRHPGLAGYGELTLDLVDRVVRGHQGIPHTPGVRPAPLGQDAIRATLIAAAALPGGSRLPALDGFAPMPSVDRARELIGRGDPDETVRDVLALAANAPVTRADRAHVLWAAVKAVESVENVPNGRALAMEVLHLPPGANPDTDQVRADLFWTAMTAAAVGRDSYRPAALAAHDLELHGALGPQTLLRSDTGAVIGRNWTGRPVQGTLVTDTFRLAAPGAAPGFRAWQSHWKTPGRPATAPDQVYLLAADGLDGHIDMPWPSWASPAGGPATRRVPPAEIAELLTQDRHLHKMDPQMSYLLPVGLSGSLDDLADRLVSRTTLGRAVLAADQPLRLVHLPADDQTVLVMTLAGHGGPQSGWVQTLPQPIRWSPRPTPAPAPTPAPVSAPAPARVTTAALASAPQPATTDRDRMTSGHEPAPASRPALSGLNRDADPVGRAPAEPGVVPAEAVVVSERVAEPLADPVAARTADPAAAYEDAQAVPQEQRSRSEAARPGMLEPGESRTVPGPPLIVLTPPTTADDEPAAGHQEPAGGIPWFARHGMLGGAEVLDVPQWTADQAATAAAEVVDRLALGADVSAAVRRAVRDNVRELLLERGAEAWQEILLHGRLLVADGRLVWLRPVLDGGSAVALPPGPDDPVRRYHVSFNATSADHVTSHAVNHTADILLSTAINVASAAASAAVIGVPQVAVSAGGVKQTGGHHTVIGGRKLFVKDTNSFTAGLRVQVFVDGEEQHPAEASRPPVVDRGLTVRFPSQLSRSTEPDPALADPAPRNVRSLPHQRFRRAGEVLHAIDVTPMLADDQRYLRRTLGLGAEKALEVVEQSQPGLNEESVLNRARWWLSSGDVSTKIRVGRSLKGLKPFRGHLRRRMVVESAQFLQVMSDADVREDRGAGYTAISGEGGESGLSLFGGFNMTGLVDPVLGSADRVKGLAPLLGVTAAFGQDWSRGLDSQGLVHAVVNTTEVQARYRVRLRVTRDWILGSHRRMDTVDSVVEAELGVLWDDGKGAADFERRVLGGVRTPYVLGALAGQVPASVVTRGGGTLKLWPAPVEAQPHVRALLAAAKVSPVRRHRRPASLDALHTPHPKEPLWLAARKGFGFHASVALPGAERVEDHFRARLEEWSAPSDGPLTRPFRGLTGRRDPARGRFSTDTKLATYVGRPALEGKFGTAMGGFKEEITHQGRRYEMGVRAHLTEHLGYRFHQAKINVRAAKGEGAVAGRGGKWEVKGGAGGGARVSLGSFLRLQASTLRLLARYGRGHKDSLESVAKGYRRTETDGDVHEHVYNVVYELTLRPLSGEGRAETWFVSRDKSLVAQISVPDQYVPAIPPSMEEVIATGRTAVLSELPAGRTLNLRNATTGLYPFFQTVPELARAAARAYARIHGLDTISADDFERMPREIVNATGPDELTVWTDHLADGLGREVELPEHDGWKTTMMLHLAAYDAQRLPGEATEAEIEQLAQLARRRTRERHTGIGLGVRVDLGPQARFGSDQGGEVEATDSHAGSGGTGEHTRPPGGRFAFLAHGQYETEWVSSHGSSDGFVENSRATYNGKKARFGAGSVFTVVMVRHKGQKVETDTSYVHSERGMYLLIPERLVEDVLPAQDEDVLTAQDEEVNAAPLRVYAGGQIPTSAMFIERLDVDVLGAIRQRLLDQGQLPRRTTADGTVMDALDPLSRALRAIFRSSALMLSGPALLDLGLWFAIKVEGIGGASWDQIVNVRFARVDAADAHRARPEVDLTLRGESTGERKDGSKFRRVLDFGVIAAGHGGTHVTDGGSHGNGGLDVAGGWSAVHSQGTDGAQKDVFIYRATTKGGSEEFQHNVALQIELGTALALPASASLVTAPGRLMNLGAGAVARIFDRRDDYDMFLETLRPWVRYDDGADRLVPGRMRVLVPSYLTAPMPEGTTAKPGPAFVRGYGQSPRWRDAVPAPAALSEELSGALHSWGVSAAAAMQRWVKVAAFDAGREGRLDLATPWEVPGIDITTKAGRDYLHDTSHTRIRPRILELLGHRHVVKVGNREVMVGFELSKAAEFAPSTDEVRHKARHYRQQDAEQKAEAEHERGWYVGVGPVGGGGSGQETFLGRLTPYERASVRGGKDTAGQAQTDESNRESTRDYRYYRFWVKLVMTPLHRPGRQLTVDVPDGLIGMLPRDDADRLVGELLARYPQPPAEPRRGRLQPRTEPSPRAHAVSSDPATTGRHRTTAEPEPAPASRPVLGGLNLDWVPVDRPRAERTPTDTVPAEPAVSAPVERVVPVEQPAGQAVPVEVAASERAPERAEQPAGQAVPVEVAASAPVERVEPAVPLARETAPADAARVEPVAATPVLPEGVRMLPITPRLTLHRFDLDGGQSGLSVAELDAAQALLEQDDPAVGEAHAAELGARVAAKITAQWAAEGLDPSQAGVELHMEAPARIAVAMVLARTVTDTLRHRVHVTVGRMAAIEMCPSGIA